MPASVYYPGSTPTPDQNKAYANFWTSVISGAVNALIGKFVEPALGDQITTIFDGYTIDAATGALVRKEVELSFSVSDTNQLTVSNGSSSVSFEVNFATGVVASTVSVAVSLALAALLPEAAIAWAVPVLSSAISWAWDTYGAPYTTTALDDLLGQPQVQLIVRNDGSEVAGGFFKNGLAVSDEIDLGIGGLLVDANFASATSGIKPIVPGMQIEFDTLSGAGASLRSLYTVYDGKIIQDLATEFGRTSGSALISSDLNELSGIKFLATWVNASDHVLVPDRYVDSITVAAGGRRKEYLR